MPRYTLAAPEKEVVICWLFEPNGWLDYAVNTEGISAREALAADPELDVTQWMRDNTFDDPEMYELGLTWWILQNDGVNVPPPNRPPETPEWIAILQERDASIDRGFARVPQSERDKQNPVTMYDETCQGEGCEPIGTMPGGSHLAHQKSLFNKVLGVLQ